MIITTPRSRIDDGNAAQRRPVGPDELDAELAAAGLDAGTRGFVVGLDVNIAEGTLGEVTGELGRLIGRPTTPLVQTLRALV